MRNRSLSCSIDAGRRRPRQEVVNQNHGIYSTSGGASLALIFRLRDQRLMTIASLLKSGRSRCAAARAPMMLAAVGLLAVAAAGCENPKPLPPAVIPPHAAAPPPVSLSSHVVEAASEYRSYVRLASATPASYPNGPAIEQSLASAEAYEPQQLSRGVVAYAAMVALQDPSFVAGVRTYAVDPEGRRSLAAKIAADPSYAAALPSASSAAGLIISTLDADRAKLRGARELVEQFAYD